MTYTRAKLRIWNPEVFHPHELQEAASFILGTISAEQEDIAQARLVITYPSEEEEIMPSVKEIQLNCTPEQWEVLCLLINRGQDAFVEDGDSGVSEQITQSIIDKISEINKRLVFASSIPEH